MSTSRLPSKVLKTLLRFSMVRPGERVLVGLSGGPDSVALTLILRELAPRLELSLALAHLNHALRAESDEDEAFCRELAEELSLPFASARVDVMARAASSKRSIEDEARRARYRFLEAESDRLGCERVAVGHTLDDQAETFLLRLLRGSGGRGLGAIHPVVDGTRIRPLIEVRRSEILGFLEARAVPFREDPSNADPRFVRNRIRHGELPRLALEYNPRLAETLARSASILREEDEFLDKEARRVEREVAFPGEDGIRIDVSALNARHPAMRRRLVRLALERIRGGLENVGHVHVEDLLTLAGPGKSGRAIQLPGVLAERSFDEIRIRPVPGGRPTPGGHDGSERGYNGFEYRLSIPARVRIPERGGTLLARVLPAGSVGGTRVVPPAVGNAVFLGIEGTLPEPSELKLRSPRPGDRFRPLGATGSKPLTRYLMERKVDREQRKCVPLVVLSRPKGDEILWVVGHGVSEASRLSSQRHCLSFEWVTR